MTGRKVKKPDKSTLIAKLYAVPNCTRLRKIYFFILIWTVNTLHVMKVCV